MVERHVACEAEYYVISLSKKGLGNRACDDGLLFACGPGLGRSCNTDCLYTDRRVNRLVDSRVT